MPLQAPQQLLLHGHLPGLQRCSCMGTIRGCSGARPGRLGARRRAGLVPLRAYGTGALRLFLPGKRLKAIDGTGGSGYALGVDQANINSGRI